MESKVLGKAGMRVSRLGFGASSLGGALDPLAEREGIRAVHAALDAGIDYFDVAPADGGTLAEAVLGKALRGIARERYRLSTKAGEYRRPGHHQATEADCSRARIRHELAASMKRLGVDRIDLVLLHDFACQGRPRTGAAFSDGFAALAELKEEGRIGAVGACLDATGLWRRVAEEAPVDAIMLRNHYCLGDTRGLELLPLCRARDIGLINASPFAGGPPGSSPAGDGYPAGPAGCRLLAQASRHCEARGSSLAKLAFQFATKQSPFATTLFSTSRADSVARNLAWFREPIDWDLLAEVLAILEPVRDRQWDHAAAVVPLGAGHDPA